MTSANLPPIGAYCRERAPVDPRRTVVYRIAAIVGRVPTSAGALVPPSPTITIEDVRNKERSHMTLAKFNADYFWEHAE